MDADKTGFLRSATSLIQQIGRAARNVNATVILYADTTTDAMQQAIDETQRRREKQLAYNAEHDITPETVKKAIRYGIEQELRARQTVRRAIAAEEPEYDKTELITELEKQMLEAAEALAFEKAAALRDQIKQLKDAPDIGPVRMTDAEPPKPKPGTPGTRVTKKHKKTRTKR